MAQWLVTQGEHQFHVGGMSDLVRLARSGELRAGDMIQPPGTTDWLYVSEVPELRAIVEQNEDAPKKGALSLVGLATVGGVLALVVVAGGGLAVFMASQLETKVGPMIGEGGLQYSQMIVTDDDATLVSEPAATGAPVAELDREQPLELLAKRGSYYRARTAAGKEGWVGMDAVIPLYQLASPEVRQELDPLYNPDRYVEVANASWTQPQEQKGSDELVTVFNFMIQNESGYAVTDLVLQAVIKDAKGHEIERILLPLEGEVPPHGMTMVGTLATEVPKGKRKAKADPDAPPPKVLTEWTFMKMSETDPDLQLRYSAGAEVKMSTPEFTNALVSIYELRAVPNEKISGEITRAQ
ncbi:MAG: hypothetical protein H0V89_09830 [Deltaproteobacteria bacterium]|nr:hypothetical protein [Deltaproteobacteria bacterium]